MNQRPCEQAVRPPPYILRAEGRGEQRQLLEVALVVVVVVVDGVVCPGGARRRGRRGRPVAMVTSVAQEGLLAKRQVIDHPRAGFRRPVCVLRRLDGSGSGEVLEGF